MTHIVARGTMANCSQRHTRTQTQTHAHMRARTHTYCTEMRPSDRCEDIFAVHARDAALRHSGACHVLEVSPGKQIELE